MKIVSLVGFAVFALVGSVACSAAEPVAAPSQDESTDSETAATTKPKKDTKTTTEPTKTVADPVTPAPSKNEPPVADDDPRKVCLSGCATENPEGAGQFSAIVTPCACDAKVCGDVCGDSCSSDKADKDLVSTATAECRACVVAALQPGGSCNAKVMGECPKQASCLPFALCVQGCAQ